jgi:hypothetical protein
MRDQKVPHFLFGLKNSTKLSSKIFKTVKSKVLDSRDVLQSILHLQLRESLNF